jgi:DNA-binding PadR family transcriptional regulator
MARTLGEFEQLVLLALLDLDEEKTYSVHIRASIERRTGRRVSIGAVYTALDRLAARGFVASRLGEPTAERSGRRKRLYRLEPVGARALADSIQVLQNMSRGLLRRLDLELAGDSARSPRSGR